MFILAIDRMDQGIGDANNILTLLSFVCVKQWSELGAITCFCFMYKLEKDENTH